MERIQTKVRNIRFFSPKNGTTMTVNRREVRNYAKQLESRNEVIRYEVLVPLDKERFCYVNPVDIRKSYFQTDWATDFMLFFKNDEVGVREVIKKSDLSKRAVMEKLEFSRRYWAAAEIRNWKIVIVEE